MWPRKIFKLLLILVPAATFAILSAAWLLNFVAKTSFRGPGLPPRAVNLLRGPSQVDKKILRVVNAPNLMTDMEQPRPRVDFILDPRDRFEHIMRDTVGKVRWSSVNMVKSALGNKVRRDTIRETWGSLTQYNDTRILTVFILGQTPDKALQREVEEEFQKFGDILQTDLPDDYGHVPNKTLAGMQWASEVLPEHWLYSSADDDVALHVPNFVRYIDTTVASHARNYLPVQKIIEYLPIMCVYSYSAKDPPARNPKSKWYMSTQRYAPRFWPAYCRGGWYTMPVSTVIRLYKISRFMPFLHLDDVWITGLMRIKLLAFHEQIPEESLLNAMITPAPLSQRSDKEFRRNTGEEDLSQVIVSHVWGNIKGRNVDVSQLLREKWKKWGLSQCVSCWRK